MHLKDGIDNRPVTFTQEPTMSQSLLDDQSSPPEDDKEARIHQLEKKVDTLNCELTLLRQHMDNGFTLVRSDIAARFAESDLRNVERFAEAENKNAERFASIRSDMRDRFEESARRQEDSSKALGSELRVQMLEMDKRQEARIVEMSRRQDTFSRWMVGLSLSVVILFANMASRFF